jgi:hypothetical protein
VYQNARLLYPSVINTRALPAYQANQASSIIFTPPLSFLFRRHPDPKPNTWAHNNLHPLADQQYNRMGWSILSSPQINPESSSRASSKAKDLEDSSQHAPSRTETDNLKVELKSLLSKNGGSTNDPDVVAIVDQLSELNPCIENCAQSPGFLGDFQSLTCPNFPGRLKPQPGQEGLVQYTLGRMSFNIFQPAKLVCTMRSVRNPVAKQGTTDEGKMKLSYPLVVDLTIHTPDGDLPAILINEANCYENSDVNNRLMVSFTGGTLMPGEAVRDDPSKLKLWERTFEGAYKKADKERSYFGWAFQFFIKLLLGLTYPTDASLSKHSFHFEMQRSPVGYLDILYLDEDLRITKGNRGTIVIAERLSKSFSQ